MDTGTGMEQNRGLSGSSLKMIAMVAMCIDHFAATVLERQLSFGDTLSDALFILVYYGLRLVGRVAFPIFIYLLVQGLEHTRNRWKYLLRMCIFAIVSEIPFDMAFNLSRGQIFHGKLIEFTYQNVFFTLALGLLVIIGIKAVNETNWKLGGKVFCNIGITAAGMVIAALLQTDYGAMGVLAITVMYLFRSQPIVATCACCAVLMLASFLEFTAFAVVPLIVFYNGTRGWKMKWLFYIFYPAHLLVFWLICLALGIA